MAPTAVATTVPIVVNMNKKVNTRELPMPGNSQKSLASLVMYKIGVKDIRHDEHKVCPSGQKNRTRRKQEQMSNVDLSTICVPFQGRFRMRYVALSRKPSTMAL
jgi:hypothetical protein